MNTYLISYDLRQPGKDYTTLHNHLKSYGTWTKPLESVWLIKSGLSYTEIRNAVRLYVDTNDKILVTDVTKQATAWSNLSDTVSTWIKNNL